MPQMKAIRETFFQECEEQITTLETCIQLIQQQGPSSELVNSAFRAVHSIKGGAGAFQLDSLVTFTHSFESMLEKLRSGSLLLDAGMIKLMFRAVDALADVISMSREGHGELGDRDTSIISEINSYLGKNPIADDDDTKFNFEPIPLSFDAELEVDEAKPKCRNEFRICFDPKKELFDKANEPQLLFRELEGLGSIEIACSIDTLPLLSNLDPDQSYLKWILKLGTTAVEGDVEQIFEFVAGDCELTIIQVAVDLHPYSLKHNQIPESKPQKSANDINVEVIASSPKLHVDHAVPPSQAHNNPIGLGPGAQSTNNVKSTIRVELDKVDRLINLAGELVIGQSMLNQRLHKSLLGKDSEILTCLDDMQNQTRDLQERIMGMRAQPIKPLFQRMFRIVREAAEATGKEVVLKTRGEATEVDKIVIEHLTDPLTHLVRNCIDHGIENSDIRSSFGKSKEGSIQVTAAHRSGRVVIEVVDDGGGIDRPKVLALAIEKGLVPDDAQLTTSEIDDLLFLPGFSTVPVASMMSGRGVGMDVVKKSILALGGRITIISSPGVGSTFTLSLPLTLAVLDGIVVTVGEQTFVVPLTVIVETSQPRDSKTFSLGDGSRVIRVRDTFVPLLDVGSILHLRLHSQKSEEGVIVLVEIDDGRRVALLVDAIVDQRQVVIKSLETNYIRTPGVAAATILGDGRVALILDVESLIDDNVNTPNTQERIWAKAS